MSVEVEDVYEIDDDSQSETYRPRKRLERRKVTQSTRRRSTLLYLEKYGLDQPNWYTSPEQQQEEEIILAESPTSIEEHLIEHTSTTTTTTTRNTKQPTSYRNSVQITTSQKRPSRFIKPEKSSFVSPSLQISVMTPSEFKHVQRLFDTYSAKIYLEGYLYKKNHLNSKGTTCEPINQDWDLYYIELSGPVLTLWNAQKSSDEDVIMPQYINIMDSTVTPLEDQKSFSLNSAGTNRFLFQSLNKSSLTNWILAIRLSCFECAKIQELYTNAFILRPQFNHITSMHHKSKSGYVQVRFPGATGWKRFWAVASNHKRGLLFKRSNNSKIFFYESKKAKYPIMTLDKVVQAYTVYPESPKLIKMATLFKIEGSLYKSANKLVSASSSALVMAADTNDLVDWLVSIFDIFKLYGRPNCFLDDPKNQNSLNFGDQRTDNLFLELQDVIGKVDVGLSSNLLLNKIDFSSILHNKMTSTLSHKNTPPATVSNHPTAATTHSLSMVCASDESEEEDEADIDVNNDSLFSTKETEKIEVTNSESKSSSEASRPSPSTPSSDNLFLPVQNNADTCSISTSSSTSTRYVKKPFYAQQKCMSTSHLSHFSPTQWPMYASTGSIFLKDHWESSRPPVHNTSTYKSPSSYYAASIGTRTTDEDDDDDDNTPIGESFASLPFHHPKQPENQTSKTQEQMNRMMFEQQQRQLMLMQQQVCTNF